MSEYQLRILSLGAGRQSSALVEMIVEEVDLSDDGPIQLDMCDEGYCFI